jgi:hypothetical protein
MMIDNLDPYIMGNIIFSDSYLQCISQWVCKSKENLRRLDRTYLWV